MWPMYRGWRWVGLVFLVTGFWCSEPVYANWSTPLQQVTQALRMYKTETLIALQSEALWYHVWQVEGVESVELLQHLHASMPLVGRVLVQKNEVLWEQSSSSSACAVRLQKVEVLRMLLSLQCMRSEQPTYQPLLRHAALQLLWAWEENVAGGVVEHQWYSLPATVEAPSLLQGLVQERFSGVAFHIDQHALSLQTGTEQWLLTWLSLGEQVGVYVLRWR